jgi:hypothetical protein
MPAPQPTMDALPLIIDGPLLNDGDPAHAGYVAGIMKPWGAGMRVYRSASSSGFTLDTQLVRSARIGQLTEPLWSGPTSRWDRVNTLELQLFDGQLASAEETAVLNGANALMVDNGLGEWELLQFATARLIAPRTYALTTLLRGQRGTENAMRDPVPAGARVIVVDKAIQATAMPSDLAGLDLVWRAGPATQDIGGAGYQQLTASVVGKARRPLSPCRLVGRRDYETGDWTISWVRRTRVNGDSWEQLDVPLGEEAEAYQLDILDGPGGDVLRTFEPTSTSQAYTASQQETDFGDPAWSFYARVAQVSGTWGPGIFTENLIWVR